MSLDLTVTDLFCGAGGSSQGAQAAGAVVKMAANHWKLAVETHSTNFPDTDHDCADVSQVEPRRYPGTDILLASPECTHHSQARSNKHVPDLFDPKGDPASERSRATMWDVVRFTEQHRYQAVVVENVVEVTKWQPFDAWLSAMDSLGYDHRLISLNSMVAAPDHGQRAPQSRDRLYVVFWRKGNRVPNLDIRVESWCATCDSLVSGRQSFKRPDRRVGKYRSQYVYTCPTCHQEVSPLVSPAAAAIDWSLPCPRIGDRIKPLAAATMRRIATGLERFGPSVVQQAGNTFERPGYVRAWPVSEPMKAQTATLQHGVAVPSWMVHTLYGTSEKPPRDVLLPFPTQTGRLELGMATAPWFVMTNRTNNQPRTVDEPVTPFCTATHHGLVGLPQVVRLRGTSDAHLDRSAHPVTEPLGTASAGGNHEALVMAPTHYVKGYGDGSDPSMVHELTDPLGTVTSQDHHGLVALPFVSSYYGNGGAYAVTDPVPTQTGKDHHALVQPEVAVEDCGFRMFEPHEVQAGMAFADDYEVLGNKRDRVKQLGNAVTPPAMAVIVGRVIESLA